MNNRVFWVFLLIVGGVHSGPLAGQFPSDRTARLVAQQEAEERYLRLSSTVEDLLAANTAFQQRISNLEKQLAELRKRVEEALAGVVSPDDLGGIVTQVREVDRRRESDKALILQELGKLRQAQVAAIKPPAREEVPVAPQRESAPPESTPGSAVVTADQSKVEKPKIDKREEPIAEEGFWVEIERGYTISAIAKAYRDQGINVSVKEIMEANPGINPKALPVGKKIFVPYRGR